MRVGAPVVAVAPTGPADAGIDAIAVLGSSDSIAGSAMQAPTPRRKRRRLRLVARWAAIWSGVSVGCGWFMLVMASFVVTPTVTRSLKSLRTLAAPVAPRPAPAAPGRPGWHGAAAGTGPTRSRPSPA